MPRFAAIRRLEFKRPLQQPHPTKFPPNRPRNQHNPLDIPHPHKTRTQRGNVWHRQTQRAHKSLLVPVGQRAIAIGDIKQLKFAYKSVSFEEFVTRGFETENSDEKHVGCKRAIYDAESKSGEFSDWKCHDNKRSDNVHGAGAAVGFLRLAGSR